ncbi:hypothetical protein LRS05_04205 [Flavobacterium sp. J372]|uniref:hypothetical protein n=1 Tax=Flavobacterium sp. J372 TaxID=2898436 RepID=UPI002151322B|nr:hypothetical protein [Flavobacterium sp. J372]MCR5861400.1 hypothetical protein [Flavobacterium sp. J372]
MKLYNIIKIAVPALMLALTAASCKEEANAADKIKDGAVATSANTPEEDEQAKQVAAANQAAAPDVTTANGQQVIQEFNVPAPAPTAPGMNPPHGQPGHRCDIAVGAPLSSAPAKPKATPQASAQIQPAEFAPPAVKDAAATASVETPPGMNPPHGQPGHVCSVAVGAPLPK